MDEEVRKKRGTAIIILAVLALLCVAAVIFLLVLNPGNTAGKLKEQLKLGERYLDELDYEKAVAAYKAALEIDPENEEALEGLEKAYRQWMESEPERAEEIREEEIRDLEELLSKKSSEQIEQLLEQERSDRLVQAPTETPTPSKAPTKAPTPTEQPVPTPEDGDTDEGGNGDEADAAWKNVDFSSLLNRDNAQYVLDRLVAEEGWTYGASHSEVYKESFDEAGNSVGMGQVALAADEGLEMNLYYQIPKEADGAGLGSVFYDNEISMQEAYDEIVRAITLPLDEMEW